MARLSQRGGDGDGAGLVHRRELEDGRVVAVRRHNAESWETWIEDEPALSIGSPLNSGIAEVIGYRVAHEEWPRWIDIWAAEIENA